jgi:hypothetical protein
MIVIKIIMKDAEQLGKKIDLRMLAGTGEPPIALPKKLQQPPSKANLPGHFSGLQTYISGVCLTNKSKSCYKASVPGTVCAKPKP